MTPSSGNVFVDLGFGEVEAFHLELRSDLMDCVEQVIQERGLSQREAARLFGVTQPESATSSRGDSTCSAWTCW